MRKNKIEKPQFLTGQEEALAFEKSRVSNVGFFWVKR
jgi:hypothetical protein